MARHPANAPQPEQPQAIESWPAAPKDMDEGESEAWTRLGQAAMTTRLVTVADLLIAEEAARVMAKIRQLYADPELSASTLKAWLDLLTRMLGELGLSPKARKNIAVPKPAKKTKFGNVLG